MHLQNGASLVGYSGGKCLRGPQSAGLLLGRKDLVKAAWVHSAPHHGFGRAMKVGKEEAIGMLMAVEMWVKRDHDAEWKQWVAMLDHIDTRVRRIAGVTTSWRSRTASRTARRHSASCGSRPRSGFTGNAVVAHAAGHRAARRPARRPGHGALSGVSITPYMMSARRRADHRGPPRMRCSQWKAGAGRRCRSCRPLRT